MLHVASLPVHRNPLVVSAVVASKTLEVSLTFSLICHISEKKTGHFLLCKTRQCNVIINHLSVRLASQLAASPSSLPIRRINHISCSLQPLQISPYYGSSQLSPPVTSGCGWRRMTPSLCSYADDFLMIAFH